jgi:hypothetical protein
MATRYLYPLMLLLLFLSLSANQSAPATNPASAFQQLAGLVGTWRIADRPQSPLRIHFSITAGGTVLVESWERNGRPHSLTLYHRDGARLIATHYCPQGNQPRLALDNSASLRFQFIDATDLDVGESHLQSIAFDLAERSHPIRREHYRKDGVDEEESVLKLERAD